MNGRRLRTYLCAAVIAAGVACQQAQQEVKDATTLSPDADIATLKADIQTLKDKATSASVAMADVSFHWSNLWFAGQAKNWPLANYYYSESRNHVRWLIRINPMPKGFADVKAAIDKKDSAKFAAAYQTALESCYSCHKSVGRPYLRPQIPTTVPQTIVNMDPNATWPQ